MRGVTKLTRYSRAEDVFQPALPMRGVTSRVDGAVGARLFQPALPMRGVTLLSGNSDYISTDFNPHSPCGE